MKTRHIFIAVLCMLCSISICKSQVPEGYELVWQDEFNDAPNADGSLPVPGDKWWFETGGSGWGNNELQYYVDRMASTATGTDTVAKIKDGNLVITAFKLPKPYYAKNYLSARMNTVASWKYGYFEAKIKVATGRGTWSAFWMMPKFYTSWPLDGEIDIMEYVGYNPNVTHASIHTDMYNHKIGTEKTATKDIQNAESEFHIYALEWTEDKIVGYVDGVAYFTFNNDHAGNKKTWPFNQPFYLKFNLAIGGDWGGLQGVAEDIFPARYEIDYVRVYQNKTTASIENEKRENVPFTFNKENKSLSIHIINGDVDSINITDMQGRLCKTKYIEDSFTHIDCSDLPQNSVYILTLVGKKKQENYKFIN